jgi:hypothetical protein
MMQKGLFTSDKNLDLNYYGRKVISKINDIAHQTQVVSK